MDNCWFSSSYISSDSSKLLDKSAILITQSFTFDRHSVLDATVYLNGSPQYVITTSKSNTRTDISDISNKSTIATIKRREILADTVKFPGRSDGSSVAVNKWLKSVIMPGHVEPFAMLTTDTGNFVWKTDAAYRLALYHEDNTHAPVAFMIRARPPEPLVLNLASECERMVKDVLVSFIILEQRLRMKEKRRTNAMLYGPVSSV